MKVPLSERFKELLKALSVNQTEFCKAADLDRGAFNRVVNGFSIPRFDAVESIYLAYPSINPHWLLTGEGKPLGSAPIAASPDKVSALEREVAYLQDKIKMQEEIITLLKSR